MTALSAIRDLIDRELGSTGWVVTSVENLDCVSPDGAALRTQRGDIPFSTVKILLELIPELVRECDYAEYSEDAIQRATAEGYSEGYEAGFEEGRESKDD